jgi:hypothetical protein
VLAPDVLRQARAVAGRRHRAQEGLQVERDDLVEPTLYDVWPSGVWPRVAEPAFLLIDPYPWSAPYEELRLKK